MPVSTRAGTGTNQEAVRRHNLATMLRSVHQVGRTSRAHLTTTMALNRSTIADLASELEALGVLRHADPVATAPRAGRPSAGIEVVEGGPDVIAIDVGVDRVVVGRVGLGGRVLERAQRQLPVSPDPRDVGDVIAELVEETHQRPGGPLVGIGVSVPGVVRRTEGIVQFAPNLGWHDVGFAQVVADRIGRDVPIALGNDADLGARAEHFRGAGLGVDHLVYISGDVGIGAGVISGGAPLGGAGGFAGEVGHMAVDPEGLTCHCGNRGCWETKIGADAIARAIGAPADSVATLGAVLDAYVDDAGALDAIAADVGRGLATIVNMLNPQVVVLGGFLASLHRLVGADIVREMHDAAMQAPGRMVKICTPGLGQNSVLLGAAELAFEALLADPVGVLA
ncbi:ROK family protein [Aeromicrobium terrae]|uniref:ROK family protein n=1 Tax=Aeromicrobium terrae TaxID=2498846 RepID=A0A5C8NK22_9ACTN|nr:ROK family protein [Aeromicrobium terrae]TXL62204.1 ROK family protein [Aeromicrobium terrae]